MRGVGAVEALQALLPAIAVVVFALVTQLGDVWFVFCVLAVLYWVGRLPGIAISRSRAAFLIGLALGALALTAGLKQFFELPRPPMPGSVVGLGYVPAILHGVYINTATASGYGFPSGHALLTTVAWGGLALVLDAGTRRRRALVAGTVIFLVCIARVVLGVHYVVDVVVGVAVGLVYLAFTVSLGNGRTRIAFWLAAAIAIASVVVGTVTFDGAATLGATVGAAVTWELLGERIPERPTRRTRILATGIGLAVLGGGFAAVYALKPAFIVTMLASAAILAGMLSLPLMVEQVEKRTVSRTAS